MSLIGAYGAKKDRKIYGNHQVFSPDGILMFRCDEKKSNWYLDRGLAKKIDDITIKLNFTPRGLGNHNKEFGLTEMGNHCVCCGTGEYLTRHHVVPHEYRRHFPLELKSHNFHDVLSMCVSCHESYEREADELKRELAIKFNSPVSGITVERIEILKASKLASTLLHKSVSIPKSRAQEIKRKLKEDFYLKRLTKQKLIQISRLKSTTLKKTHGQLVVERCGSIQDFVELWRKHFIEINNPKFLPKNWSIQTRVC
jgi:hypothetical protein